MLAWAFAALVAALALLVCTLALAALMSLASLSNGGPWRGVGEGVGEVTRQSAAAVAAAEQTVRDTFDPRHPPRESLVLDTEFDALRLVAVGETLGIGAESRLDLVAVAKRTEAADVATAQYGVVRRSLLTPLERRVLGVPLGEERGEREHYLYKGQTFRLGQHYYKVNWVSFDGQQMALARYRSADNALATPLFHYD